MRAGRRLGGATDIDDTGAVRVFRAMLKGVLRRSGAAAGRILPTRADTSLVALVERAVLSGKLPVNAFLRELDRQLRLHPRGAVAVLAGSRSSSLGASVARAYPAARIVEVDLAQSVSALHACMAAHGPFDIIADDTRTAHARIRVNGQVVVPAGGQEKSPPSRDG